MKTPASAALRAATSDRLLKDAGRRRHHHPRSLSRRPASVPILLTRAKWGPPPPDTGWHKALAYRGRRRATSNNPQLMEDTTMKRLIAKSLLVLTAVERRCS